MSEPSNNAKVGMIIEKSPINNMFKAFREEMEAAVRTWSTSVWIPSLFDYNETRMPLCEITDMGDLYELYVEVPGAGNEGVRVKAKSHSIEVFAEKSESVTEKNKGRVYTERSKSSFYRQIPLPEEIIPQKVKSKVKNGVLHLRLPKRNHKAKRHGR